MLEKIKLKETLPEYPNSHQIARHNANAAKPSGWLLNESETEKRRRNRADRLRKKEVETETKRRREKPNDREQARVPLWAQRARA